MSAVACMHYYITCSLILLRCNTYLALWRLFPTSWGQLNKEFISCCCKKCFYSSEKSGNLATKAQKTIKKKTTLDSLPSTLNKNLHSKSTYFLKLTHQESWRSNGFLKGQSQLIHMRIRYHFLADLHVTGHARETWSEDTQNKPCRVELVTSRNHDYRV